MDFEVKKNNCDLKNPKVKLYVSAGTSEINPLDIKKDIEEFVEYINEKYNQKEVEDVSWEERVASKLGLQAFFNMRSLIRVADKLHFINNPTTTPHLSFYGEVQKLFGEYLLNNNEIGFEEYCKKELKL